MVGDDDQSIYGFSGAEPGNFRSFRRDFPGSSQIVLQQNYRSTGTIVEAGAALIRQVRPETI